MAGTFAHMILVRTLCRPETLDGISALTAPMKRALMMQTSYAELGAVSPDLPYLKLRDDSAAGWGNVMHYWQTADLVRLAVPALGTLGDDDMGGAQRLAWLFGYVAHLVTDLTVHPAIVPYKGHETEHRVCELNQDVYIFDKMGFGDVNRVEYLNNGGIRDCDLAAIAPMWTKALKANTTRQPVTMGPEVQAPTGTPEPEKWHEHYVWAVDKFAEEGGRFPWITRHLLRKKSVLYPSLKKARQSEYVRGLRTPAGAIIAYEDLFAMAQRNTLDTWSELAAAISQNTPAAFALKNANLDTGLADTGGSIFWRSVA
jgi:hypothetical protein